MKSGWMKNTQAILFSLTMIVSASVEAALLPGWERPLEIAHMDVLESDGFFDSVENVVIVQNRRDNSKEEATSLTLSFDVVYEDNTSKTLQYEVPVQKVVYDRCGGTSFVASLKLFNSEMSTGFYPEIKVEMKRQSAMGNIPSCAEQVLTTEDLSTWTAKVHYVESGSVNTDSMMNLVGSPEVLYTIQGSELQ
jgi:hypothetical protein